MIAHEEGHFILKTRTTMYVMRVLESGQLEHVHYGPHVTLGDFRALGVKITAGAGGSVVYRKEEPLVSLDLLPLEYSGTGKGDFRHSPLELEFADGSYVTDFVYQGFAIHKGAMPMEELPHGHGPEDAATTLQIICRDRLQEVELHHFYTVFEATDVIARRVEVHNNTNGHIFLQKLMSLMLDLPGAGYEVLTFHGGWIREAKPARTPLGPGIFVNSSVTGASSNRHNPGFVVVEPSCTEESGICMGFNLLYSGNHYSALEPSRQHLTRVMTGLSPERFSWPIEKGQVFRSPQAIMTYSREGLNGMSHRMHDFVNAHVVPGPWQGRPRPVLVNNWEATFFDFNEKKLVDLARAGAKLGAELFVLDDGWFGEREDDTKGLGDYDVNRKKIPSGLSGLAVKIHALGLQFGIWVEPEMVSEDSRLYRTHPEWAVQVRGRVPAEGRNQLVLNLSLPEVQAYLLKELTKLLEKGDIAYVKWDMNRSMSDMHAPNLPHQGMFFHSYILGLYRVLDALKNRFPEILFESCSSGGNRFDLGMLFYTPQIWASDNTDPAARLQITQGLSYLYPLSTMGAHISQSPHQQTLRRTPLATRLNVASFGLLGLELDLAELDPREKAEIRRHIEHYKSHRSLYQFGRFHRVPSREENLTLFQVTEAASGTGVLGFFQHMAASAPPYDRLRFLDLPPEARYQVETLPQTLDIRDFGGLLKHALPLKLRPGGLLLRQAANWYRLPQPHTAFQAHGDLLMAGVWLPQRFMGTHYNKETRLLADFGSEIYALKKLR